jgi:D-beta-D-heptose 7-phosphate kinase/D-beta-D-heptose 1-phosphate adenosyltransferase
MSKVWVNGTFDVLHFGHLKLLEFASSFGNVIVGIDSDKRVKKLKGSERPFNNQEVRKFFLKSLKYVNDVVIFNDDVELENKIKDYNPDFMIIGNDYLNKNIIGKQYIKEIVFFDKIQKYSTTKILNYGKTDSL